MASGMIKLDTAQSYTDKTGREWHPVALLVLKQAIELKASTGMNLTDPRRIGGAFSTLIKKGWGFKGNIQAICDQYVNWYDTNTKS